MERVAAGHSSRRSLRECIAFGSWMAVAFCAIAVLAVAVHQGLVLATGEGVRAQPREVAAVLVLAFPGYFLAGVCGGAGYWVLHSLRQRSVAGWILTGMWVAGAAYGSMGLMLALGYQFLGINPGSFESVAEAWRFLPVLTGITAVAAGIPGGLWYWWKERG